MGIVEICDPGTNGSFIDSVHEAVVVIIPSRTLKASLKPEIRRNAIENRVRKLATNLCDILNWTNNIV